MSNRFIVIVIDGFGVGEMDDVKKVRIQDRGSNTALHLLEYPEKKEWDTLLQLGLMNVLDMELSEFKKSKKVICGTSNLKHYGADSFLGHQEIMGTNPKKPIFSKLAEVIDNIEEELKKSGFQTTRIEKDGNQMLSVNQTIFIGDNIETDLGQAINVVGALDECGFKEIRKVGEIVRANVKVARVIAFGGSNVTYHDLKSNIKVFGDYIGVDAPSSGVYINNYHVVHLGYRVDVTKQVSFVLKEQQISSYFYGKVADIVENLTHRNFPCVKSEECFDILLSDLDKEQEGFYCLNIQETDLAGHGQDAKQYINRLNVCDKNLLNIISKLNDNDILVVCADHGNDPTIGHSKHTREKIPLLIYHPNMKLGVINIGNRETLADIGATVAEYFGCSIYYGQSFLSEISSDH